VANHTSGLPLHYQFFYADEPHRAPARDETIRRFGNLVTEPGEHYQYSNLGFGVIDYVVERESGKRFADFMREEVFLPLGMTHTSIDVAAGLETHQAIRYTIDGRRIPFYDFDHPGASAVYSSAHDLARFAMFHMKEHLADQKQILSDASIDEMQKSTATAPFGSGYGIGWGLSERRGYQVVAHSGGMPGVATLCWLVPSQRLAIVVLSNSGNMMPGNLAEMIAKIMLPERKSDGQKRAEPGSGAYRAFAPSAELIGTWKGRVATYRGDTRLVMVVKDSGDIHMRLGEQLETLLNGSNFNDGWLRGRFAGELNTDDNRGRPYLLQLQMKLRGDTLGGAASALTRPDKWGTLAVTHWVELARETDKPKDAPAAGGQGER
jgi:hypothetical protein